MENKTLVIWFENGGTAYFEQVTNFTIEENVFGFNYFGVHSQVGRRAVFNFDNVAGYALQD